VTSNVLNSGLESNGSNAPHSALYESAKRGSWYSELHGARPSVCCNSATDAEGAFGGDDAIVLRQIQRQEPEQPFRSDSD
jgi:hypothetical protein